MRTLLLTEHTELTLGGKKTKQSSRSQRENTIPAEKEREREREREREVGRRNPRKYTYRAEKKTERTPTNLAILWHQIPSRPFMCVPGVAKKQLQLAEKKTPCVKERERERGSKNHPGKTKHQRKKLQKLDHLIPKPYTVNFLVPNYAPKRNTHTHTHTHKEGFFFLPPNYARKKREKRKQKKKKKKKKEEEETEREKEGSGICSFSQMEVKEQDIHDDHRHPNEACLPANELPILGNSSSSSRHRSIPSKPKQSRASEGARERARKQASKAKSGVEELLLRTQAKGSSHRRGLRSFARASCAIPGKLC
jgi:hypothetical protein